MNNAKWLRLWRTVSFKDFYFQFLLTDVQIADYRIYPYLCSALQFILYS